MLLSECVNFVDSEVEAILHPASCIGISVIVEFIHWK